MIPILVSAAASGDYAGAIVTVGTIIVTALVASVFAFIFRRTGEGARSEALWVRVDELTAAMYGDEEKGTIGLVRQLAETREDLGKVQRKASAQGRIITAVVQQSPEGFVPRLNPSDLEEIDENTIPTESPWRKKP